MCVIETLVCLLWYTVCFTTKPVLAARFCQHFSSDKES